MKTSIFTICALAMALSGCQTIKPERKNNCACMWEKPTGAEQMVKGVLA